MYCITFTQLPSLYSITFASWSFFSGSGPHRYIFLAFGHKSRIGGKKTAKVSARKGFNVKEYSEANALGNPNCINFYYTENKG